MKMPVKEVLKFFAGLVWRRTGWVYGSTSMEIMQGMWYEEQRGWSSVSQHYLSYQGLATLHTRHISRNQGLWQNLAV